MSLEDIRRVFLQFFEDFRILNYGDLIFALKQIVNDQINQSSGGTVSDDIIKDIIDKAVTAFEKSDAYFALAIWISENSNKIDKITVDSATTILKKFIDSDDYKSIISRIDALEKGDISKPTNFVTQEEFNELKGKVTQNTKNLTDFEKSGEDNICIKPDGLLYTRFADDDACYKWDNNKLRIEKIEKVTNSIADLPALVKIIRDNSDNISEINNIKTLADNASSKVNSLTLIVNQNTSAIAAINTSINSLNLLKKEIDGIGGISEVKKGLDHINTINDIDEKLKQIGDVSEKLKRLDTIDKDLKKIENYSKATQQVQAAFKASEHTKICEKLMSQLTIELPLDMCDITTADISKNIETKFSDNDVVTFVFTSSSSDDVIEEPLIGFQIHSDSKSFTTDMYVNSLNDGTFSIMHSPAGETYKVKTEIVYKNYARKEEGKDDNEEYVYKFTSRSLILSMIQTKLGITCCVWGKVEMLFNEDDDMLMRTQPWITHQWCWKGMPFFGIEGNALKKDDKINVTQIIPHSIDSKIIKDRGGFDTYSTYKWKHSGLIYDGFDVTPVVSPIICDSVLMATMTSVMLAEIASYENIISGAADELSGDVQTFIPYHVFKNASNIVDITKRTILDKAHLIAFDKMRFTNSKKASWEYTIGDGDWGIQDMKKWFPLVSRVLITEINRFVDPSGGYSWGLGSGGAPPPSTMYDIVRVNNKQASVPGSSFFNWIQIGTAKVPVTDSDGKVRYLDATIDIAFKLTLANEKYNGVRADHLNIKNGDPMLWTSPKDGTVTSPMWFNESFTMLARKISGSDTKKCWQLVEAGGTYDIYSDAHTASKPGMSAICALARAYPNVNSGSYWKGGFQFEAFARVSIFDTHALPISSWKGTTDEVTFNISFRLFGKTMRYRFSGTFNINQYIASDVSNGAWVLTSVMTPQGSTKEFSSAESFFGFPIMSIDKSGRNGYTYMSDGRSFYFKKDTLSKDDYVQKLLLMKCPYLYINVPFQDHTDVNGGQFAFSEDFTITAVTISIEQAKTIELRAMTAVDGYTSTVGISDDNRELYKALVDKLIVDAEMLKDTTEGYQRRVDVLENVLDAFEKVLQQMIDSQKMTDIGWACIGINAVGSFAGIFFPPAALAAGLLSSSLSAVESYARGDIINGSLHVMTVITTLVSMTGGKFINVKKLFAKIKNKTKGSYNVKDFHNALYDIPEYKNMDKNVLEYIKNDEGMGVVHAGIAQLPKGLNIALSKIIGKKNSLLGKFLRKINLNPTHASIVIKRTYVDGSNTYRTTYYNGAADGYAPNRGVNFLGTFKYTEKWDPSKNMFVLDTSKRSIPDGSIKAWYYRNVSSLSVKVSVEDAWEAMASKYMSKIPNPKTDNTAFYAKRTPVVTNYAMTEYLLNRLVREYPSYNLALNNCQHYANGAYRWIQTGEKPMMLSNSLYATFIRKAILDKQNPLNKKLTGFIDNTFYSYVDDVGIEHFIARDEVDSILHPITYCVPVPRPQVQFDYTLMF